MTLIVKIDGYYHQVLIKGKKCSKQELMKRYINAQALTTDILELPAIFYRVNCFDQLAYNEDIEVDYVIDTDTDRIYKPSY
ncbi:hypothetical protein [Bacillus massilinigeriensis]|uniref:hypothetical protein n=1 Tax=Bacillus massilionigeriensis TaxID=1805475 RepID=UPI00096B4821|nr:hypothetical protein [Bacillus massilionigeriensis]